jgi:hypothetical protein
MKTYLIPASFKGSKKAHSIAALFGEELNLRLAQIQATNEKDNCVVQIHFSTKSVKALRTETTDVEEIPTKFAKQIVGSSEIKNADNFQIVVNNDGSFFFTAQLGKNKKQMTSATLIFQDGVPVIVKSIVEETEENELEEEVVDSNDSF